MLAADGSASVPGSGISHVALPPAEPGALLLLAAEAAAETVLALEQQDAHGDWQPIGRAQGTAPMLAVPAADAAGCGWRCGRWTAWRRRSGWRCGP